jgi:RimJ/RimL family protein N-acetyltransferase
LFDDARLIGITGTFAWNEDPSTAILVMSFITPEYRGRGLSRMLYEARLDWIRAQPQFKRVVVSHRVSNEASRRCILNFGFVQTKRAPHTWPDGVTEDEISYVLDL